MGCSGKNAGAYKRRGRPGSGCGLQSGNKKSGSVYRPFPEGVQRKRFLCAYWKCGLDAGILDRGNMACLWTYGQWGFKKGGRAPDGELFKADQWKTGCGNTWSGLYVFPFLRGRLQAYGKQSGTGSRFESSWGADYTLSRKGPVYSGMGASWCSG